MTHTVEWMLRSLSLVCLSLATTPLLFPTITPASSVDRPLNFLTSRPESVNSFFTISIMASELQLAKASLVFCENKNIVCIDFVSESQNWIKETSCEATDISVTSFISRPKLLAILTLSSNLCFTVPPKVRKISLTDPCEQWENILVVTCQGLSPWN